MREKKVTGKKCYDHMGGRLGAELFNFYIANNWIEPDEEKSTEYKITEKGYTEFARMGMSDIIEKLGN